MGLNIERQSLMFQKKIHLVQSVFFVKQQWFLMSR